MAGARSHARVVLAAVVSACGEQAAPPVELAAFSDAALGAICDWSVRCRHVPDHGRCERLLDQKDYDTRRVADSIAAGRLAYGAAAAGECMARTRDAHCLDVPFSAPACGEMFRGQVAVGGACLGNGECSGGADCEDRACDGQCCVGACGPPPEPIEPRSLAGIGERCASHFDCVIEAYCESDGRCAETPVDEGERCLFGCARGDLFCDLETLTCQRFGSPDEACDASGETAPPCDPAWSFCDGVCRDRPGAGEACDAGDRLCVGGLRCDDAAQTCVSRGSAGDSCQAPADCDVTCIDQVCADYQTCLLSPDDSRRQLLTIPLPSVDESSRALLIAPVVTRHLRRVL